MTKAIMGFLMLAASPALAMSIDWTGTYRFEWMQIDRPSLSSPSMAKAYGLNYLGLSPRIIASDGIEIAAKFDVLANQESAYETSQAGQLWGQKHSAASEVDTASRSKLRTPLYVRELYLNVNQEYGSLLVGRAPFEFGMGLVWDAGRDPFDHWTTNSDLIAYRFIVGNMFFMPMISRIAVDDPSASNVIQEQALQVQYESEESGSLIGAIIAQRKAPTSANDSPVTAPGPLVPLVPSGLTASVKDIYAMQTTGFVLGRKWESFRFQMEAGFMTGDYGVQLSNGEFVRNNSYGVAVEMDFLPRESKWDSKIRFGMASGDDPTTADIEGFQFHRNYDVALLMFNHRLGQADFLRTAGIRSSTLDLSTSLDDEAISNAMYLSPRIRYAWNDRWDLTNTFTYAQLMVNPTNAVDFKKDLGFEWDIEAVYKPRHNVRWSTELGLLMPGGAFKNGSADLTAGFTYGLTTRAAITF